MIERETIIVGGGPAGASAAWQLQQLGRDCLLLDQAQFPRDKLCAGWITPEVLTDLRFSAADYPYRFLTFETLHIAIYGLKVPLHSPQHSIRRVEFDHWLLERSGAQVRQHQVRTIERTADGFEIDGTYRCRYLIGAGGTRCPVYRTLFRPKHSRPKPLQAVALELEFAYDWHDADCHLWFCTDGLPGYSWYVPKADGYLNIGVGGMAYKLKRHNDTIGRHWQALVERLQQKRLIDGLPAEPKGYSYYLRERTSAHDPGTVPNAYIVGDAAGLATRDMCEGIGPAVRSGLNAANAIAGQNSTLDIAPLTSGYPLVGRALERRFVGEKFRPLAA